MGLVHGWARCWVGSAPTPIRIRFDGMDLEVLGSVCVVSRIFVVRYFVVEEVPDDSRSVVVGSGLAVDALAFTYQTRDR